MKDEVIEKAFALYDMGWKNGQQETLLRVREWALNAYPTEPVRQAALAVLVQEIES